MATKVVGSNQPQFASEQLKPSKAGYGQNQFGGASSDMPGEAPTASGFLPGADYAGAMATDKAVRNRSVSSNQYPSSFGMNKRTPRNA